MKTKTLKLFGLISLIFLLGCMREKATVEVLEWGNNGMLFTEYSYKAHNGSSKKRHIIFHIEALCDDGSIYADEAWIDVRGGRTINGSSFFDTEGKEVKEINVVEVKSFAIPF